MDSFADSAPRVAAVAMETARSNKSIPPGAREARRDNGSGGTAGVPRHRGVERCAGGAAALRPRPARSSRSSPSRPSSVARYPSGGRPHPTHRRLPSWDSVARRCPQCSNGAHGTLSGGGCTWARPVACEAGVVRARRALIGCPDFGEILGRGPRVRSPQGLGWVHARRPAAAPFFFFNRGLVCFA